MKIVSWNCNGKFREKLEYIKILNADIYIIQECEDPKKYNNTDYLNFSENAIWIGDNQNKGLGIFAKNFISIKPNDNFKSFCLRYFLPVVVNNSFNLLAVWACKPYIEEYYIYQCINKSNFDKNTIVMGDFNSNAIWDKKHNFRSHSNVVKELKELGLTSAYHFVYSENQGKETQQTFYLYRHKDKGYHIDYAFADTSKVKSFHIDDNDFWLDCSDHKPIILEI